MRILICNERFLFRFGVDRVLLMLGQSWREAGHEVIMMGNKLDTAAVDKCSDRFIYVPESPDYFHSNDFALSYLRDNWEEWFDENNVPDIALVAGWPFYSAIPFLREQCGCAIFHDYGAVPTEGMSEGTLLNQMELRRLRKENLPEANRIIAISRFLQETQSKPDAAGKTETSYVHLGLDHILESLWSQVELGIGESEALRELRQMKTQGYQLVFQPGRWETGNYKHSDDAIQVSRALKAAGIKHRILVLSTREKMGELPADVEDSLYPLGYIDDATMKAAMELSDAGYSPTTWEGFDLPLGEMQFLDRPMFVLNIGAHPEVACDPYFLCEDLAELIGKLKDTLRGKMGLPEEKYLRACAGFREVFTWENCARQMLMEMQQAAETAMTVVIDVSNACHDTANSGVMRVTRKLARKIQEKAEVIFVLWDASIYEYVFPYPGEVEMLCSYGGPEAERIAHRSVDGFSRSLLRDEAGFAHRKKKILLLTETVSASSMGRIIPWAKAHTMGVAAIFHDAIPVLRPELVSPAVAENHRKYMKMLAECDLVLPTAAHNQEDLETWWQEQGIEPTRVQYASLAAEIDGKARVTEAAPARNGRKQILFVSTLEPRKNHIRLLNAFGRLMDEYPETQERVTLRLVGNRYMGNEEIPAFVEAFCREHSNVQWLGVVDDETLMKEYEECDFTVYPSEIEGFGMPIIESLWSGKPCLCSNTGSIGELGSPGGCCQVDVLDENALAEGLYRLIMDQPYYEELRRQTMARPITTWEEYGNRVLALMAEIKLDSAGIGARHIPLDIQARIREYFGSTEMDKVIIACNFYPPEFVGGAEIIARNQGITMLRDGLAKVMVFTLEHQEEEKPGTLLLQEDEGLPVLRMKMPEGYLNTNGPVFFHREVDEVFESLCEVVQPDVLHCHNVIGMSLGMACIAKRFGAKVFFTLHDNWGICYKNTLLDTNGNLCRNIAACSTCMEAMTWNGSWLPIKMRRDYVRRVFEKVDACVSPSEYQARAYLRAGFDSHRMHVLWNGIDVEKYTGIEKIPSEKIRISYVGYFGAHKGINVLLYALKELGNSRVQINLVGKGDQEEHFRNLAARLGVAGQIRFWGSLPNEEIRKVYAETDIYCLPSIWPENQPVTITEAMACGIPVIASDLGGSRELIRDGETGLLFKAGDAKDLAEKIRMLVENAGLRDRYGRGGQARMKENDFHSQVRKLSRMYQETPVRQVRASRRILAVLGDRLPRGVEKIIRDDLLLWDWCQEEADWREVRTCLILQEAMVTKQQMKKMREGERLILIPESMRKGFRDAGIPATVYRNDLELYGILRNIQRTHEA